MRTIASSCRKAARLSLAVMGLSLLASCQTLQGIGKDLGNLGKPKPQDTPVIAAAEVKKEAVAAKAPGQADAKPAGKNIVQEMWEQIFRKDKPQGQAKEVKKLKPGLFKKEMLSRPMRQPDMTLEDLPAKTDIQEVPAASQSMEGAIPVDVNGDGVPDARYRQRD